MQELGVHVSYSLLTAGTTPSVLLVRGAFDNEPFFISALMPWEMLCVFVRFRAATASSWLGRVLRSLALFCSHCFLWLVELVLVACIMYLNFVLSWLVCVLHIAYVWCFPWLLCHVFCAVIMSHDLCSLVRCIVCSWSHINCFYVVVVFWLFDQFDSCACSLVGRIHALDTISVRWRVFCLWPDCGLPFCFLHGWCRMCVVRFQAAQMHTHSDEIRILHNRTQLSVSATYLQTMTWIMFVGLFLMYSLTLLWSACLCGEVLCIVLWSVP